LGGGVWVGGLGGGGGGGGVGGEKKGGIAGSFCRGKVKCPKTRVIELELILFDCVK